MAIQVQYITNQNGEKQAVIVPIEDWHSLNKQLEDLQKNTRFYDDISESMREAINLEKNDIVPQNLIDFLDDC